MKNKLIQIGIIALLAAAAVQVQAVPPRDWKFLKNKPAQFKPCGTMSPEQVKALQAQGALRKAGKMGVIAPQTKKMIVVRVDFLGGPTMSTSKADAEAFFAKFASYYSENSYGRLKVDVTVTDTVYTLPSVSYYNNETGSALTKLRTDVNGLSAADINYADYDYMMIYHAGYGEEDSGDPDDLWSLFYGLTFFADSKQFYGFTVVPELARTGCSPLSVICHEFGHQLGLPDLYDTTVFGGSSTCGAWSVMDYPYGYDNTGKNPPHLDPWSKNFLQFIDLDLPSRVASRSIPDGLCGDIETSQTTGYYKIPVGTNESNQEYFIVEYRQPLISKAKYDLSLPGSGVLVWHIDDAIAQDSARQSDNTINSGSPHLAVGLVAANGATDYPIGSNQPGVPFGEGTTFTTPQSNAFDGSVTNITVSDLAFSGDRLSLKVGTLAAAGSVKVNRILNYPNPAGSGYDHPRQGSGVVTTIVVQLTRPPEKMDLAIYTMAGELVRLIEKDKLSLRLVASTDFRWVYEYDWNGKNDSGADVAPGVYFMKVNADNEVKVGKLAIVR
jgi:M6 family metalloprotease-like protein